MDDSIKNIDLVNILFSSNKRSKKSSVLLNYFEKQWKLEAHVLRLVEEKLNRLFLPTFNKKWKHSFFQKASFLEHNTKWLKDIFTIPTSSKLPKPKLKSYEEVSTSTKKRRINQILEEIPATDILNACLKKAGSTSEIESNDVDNCENQSNDNSNTNDSSIIFDDEALALYIIMQAMASGKPIDVNKFKKYCMDMAKIYVNKYMWYPMPSSCHMILIHGSDVIETFLIPIGQLSEEAQEARNKDIKRCRENNTRKSTPIHTNEDIIHFLLISSDPYISSLRHVHKHKIKDLHPEAQNLILK